MVPTSTIRRLPTASSSPISWQGACSFQGGGYADQEDGGGAPEEWLRVRKCALVEGVDVTDGKVTGVLVRLELEKEFPLRSVLQSGAVQCNVRNTIQYLVGEEQNSDFVQKVKAVRNNTSSCQVYMGIKKGRPSRISATWCLPPKPGIYHRRVDFDSHQQPHLFGLLPGNTPAFEGAALHGGRFAECPLG